MGIFTRGDKTAATTSTEESRKVSITNSSPDRYDSQANTDGAIYKDDTVEYDDLLVQCPPHTTERKLKTKIDLRVIPVLCILYLLAFLDRINISNARSFGLEKDLGLNPKSLQFSTAVVIFFIPYVLLEIPSNILLKRFKPHVWLPGCMFFFGLTTICQGLTKSYGGLLTARFFLGVFETGMFPGCFYLIGMWYRRAEAQKRYSFFFNSTSLAGAFGGLLAAAIGKLDGVQGYAGWRWIFILEGTATCTISLIFFFLVPDFPEDATWLTTPERSYIKSRLRADQGASSLSRRITPTDVLRVFKDPKIFLGGLMYFGLIVPAYGFAYFAPLIVGSYGYSTIETQLHTVPPWVAAFGFAMVLAYLSDRTRHRFGFVVFSVAVSMTGFGILLGQFGRTDVEYAALHLITSGTYGAMPIIVCWFTMNLGGHHRRAVGTGWQVGFGNIGGVIAAFAFQTYDAPRFITGYSICISFCCLSLLSSTVYLVSVVYQNRQRARRPVDLGLTDSQKAEMGDLSPEYRYQI